MSSKNTQYARAYETPKRKLFFLHHPPNKSSQDTNDETSHNRMRDSPMKKHLINGISRQQTREKNIKIRKIGHHRTEQKWLSTMLTRREREERSSEYALGNGIHEANRQINKFTNNQIVKYTGTNKYSKLQIYKCTGTYHKNTQSVLHYNGGCGLFGEIIYRCFR